MWGVHSHRLDSLQKKALRFMTNSSYLAHTTPLLIKHGLLNMGDMYKLKLFKFYYKLSYDLLPPYFNNYIEIIEQKPARDLRYQYIHVPLVKRVYAECSPLFQHIKLINSLKNYSNDTILEKLLKKVTHITRHEIFPEFSGIPEFLRPQRSFSWKSQIRFNIYGGGVVVNSWVP